MELDAFDRSTASHAQHLEAKKRRMREEGDKRIASLPKIPGRKQVLIPCAVCNEDMPVSMSRVLTNSSSWQPIHESCVSDECPKCHKVVKGRSWWDHVRYCGSAQQKAEEELRRRLSYSRKRTIDSKVRDAMISKFPSCMACGSDDRLELDHIVPVAAGGEDIEENLRVLCHRCNMIAWGMWLNDEIARACRHFGVNTIIIPAKWSRYVPKYTKEEAERISTLAKDSVQ